MIGRRSPLPALRGLAERTVTVADLVAAEIWQIPGVVPVAEALAELDARDFDVAAVANTPIRRFVHREDLREQEGTVADASRPIDASEIVGRALPVADLVSRLGACEHIFVMDEDQIRWLVTRADLQAPAVGMVALAYVIALEAALAELVRAELGDRFVERLPPARQARAEELFALKRQHNAETTLSDCLCMADWLQLVKGSPALRAALGCSTPAELRRLVSGLEQARNDLAHGGTLLDGRSPDDAVDLFARLRRATDVAWSRAESLDERWDAYAATVITDGSGRIWAGADAIPLGPAPWHVITAANPDRAVRPDAVNVAANHRLDEVLAGRGLVPVPVLGAAADGTWREQSVAVTGLDRSAACELGHRFGQAGIFELTSGELLVVRCPDGLVMRTRSRAVPVAPPA